MPTFLVNKSIQITRQAGDDCEIVFTVPSVFPISQQSQIRLGIFDNNKRRLFLITNEFEDLMSIDGQRITIKLSGNETANKSGTYSWELDVSNNNIRTLIGKGAFNLIGKLMQ